MFGPEVYVGPSARKRPRMDAGFTLRDCTGLRPAENPARLVRHPLREEQLRSLAWMRQQEALPEGCRGGVMADKMGYGKTAIAIGLLSSESCGAQPPQPEARMKPGEHLALSASLILAPKHLLRQWQEEFVKFLGEEAVEVIQCPDHVTAKSASGKQRMLLTASYDGPPVVLPREDRRIRLLVISDICQLYALRWGELELVDVVLTTYAVQADSSYSHRMRDVLMYSVTTARYDVWSGGHFYDRRVKGEMRRMWKKTWNVEKISDSHEFAFVQTEPPAVQIMERKLQALRSKVRQWTSTQAERQVLMKQTFPVFELFWWKRIVMDEFHESESWVYRVRELFKGIGAKHRWGLSGTPPISDLASVDAIAKILWYVEPECRARPFCGSDEEPELSHEEAQEFLHKYVCQNASKAVESIRVVNETIVVDLTPPERMLYLQACHDHGLGGCSHMSLESRAALLQRCAHFSPQGSESRSPEAEVRRLSDVKEQRVRDLKLQIDIEVARGALLLPKEGAEGLRKMAIALKEQVCPGHDWDLVRELPPEVQAQVASLAVEYEGKDGEPLLVPRVVFDQPVDASTYFRGSEDRHTVQHALATAANAEPAVAETLEQEPCCLHGFACSPEGPQLRDILHAAVSKLFEVLSSALRSLEFWNLQLKAVGGDDEDLRTCSICLEENCALDSLCILPCAHIFHMDCVRQALRACHMCPHCRQEFPPAMHLSSLQLELAPTSSASLAAPAKMPAHGSKLSALVQKLREISATEPSAKVIVFSQWSTIESKVSRALKCSGIPHLRLKPRDEGEALHTFQHDPAAPRVLLMSLESAASGSNLQAASHVIFVHPMNAASVAEAIAQERQAIGRVRRLGQLRDEIFVHRFVTRGTIEEEISATHQAECLRALGA